MAQQIILSTALGRIVLSLCADVAPQTVAHFVRLAQSKTLDGCTFYRSDFVIQFGMHGMSRKSPFPPLAVNESAARGHLSNTRGALAVAHWDVPDCGDSEFFISLKENTHLDTAYGGYCVFAVVAQGDVASWAVVDKIAVAVAKGEKTRIDAVAIELIGK